MGWSRFYFNGSENFGSSSSGRNLSLGLGSYGSRTLKLDLPYSDTQLSILRKEQPSKYGCPHQALSCNFFGGTSLMTLSACNCAVNYKKYYAKHYTIPTKEETSSQIARKYKSSILGWLREVGGTILGNIVGSVFIGGIVFALSFFVGYALSHLSFLKFLDTIVMHDSWRRHGKNLGIITILPTYILMQYTSSTIVVDWDRINQIEKEPKENLKNP